MLKCIQDFAQGERRFSAGDVVNEHPAVEVWLLDSFPAHFERIEAEAPGEQTTKDIDAAPVDKMVRRAARK